MSNILIAIGFVSVFILAYVYKLYGLLLTYLVKFVAHETGQAQQGPESPDVTILLTVHNEEKVIRNRIENLLDLVYPEDRLEILVASDGSTDQTNKIVSSFRNNRVKLFESKTQGGKTACQNQAIPLARGEIIVFTDAGTLFHRNFLIEIVKPFQNPGVGAVDGHLVFTQEEQNAVSESQGYYWDYELSIRMAESRLGILAVVSGACFAVRKQLVRNMDPSIGEDCIVPLDVVDQGFSVVHSKDAGAYDRLENQTEKEFKTRVRMTMRNWQGTWSRPELLAPWRQPGIAFALWSHKILRWLSPFFLIGLFVIFNTLAIIGEPPGLALAIAVDASLVLAILGWIATHFERRFPVINTIFSFYLANAGFFIGVIRAFTRHKVHAYRS